MDKELLVGVIIICLTWFFLWVLYRALMALFILTIDLGQYVSDPHGRLPLRVIAFFVWLPLWVFMTLVIVVGVAAGISLLKDAHQWLNRPD